MQQSTPGWLPPVFSMTVPGAGQFVQGKERGAIYLIVEAFVLERFVSFWKEARHAEDHYRDLAFRVARAPFSPTTRDTVFEYFEQMGSFLESGPYDLDAGPGFVPPMDQTTYNGATWALARDTYLPDSPAAPDTTTQEYQAALRFYQRRAVGPNFQWSWRNARLEQDVFRQTIRDGDDTFRRAQQQLGLLMANHLLSAVDAFVSQRVMGRRGRVQHRVWVSHRQGHTSFHLLFAVGLSSPAHRTQ